jgi:hypothetical protein
MILCLIISSLSAFGQYSAVTGTITDAGGNVATSGTVVFRLTGSSGVQYYFSGTGVVTPTTTTCNISGTGTISCNVGRNDMLVPAGTTYCIDYYPNGTKTNTVCKHYIATGTYSLQSPVFLTQQPSPQFSATQYYPITGSIIPNGNNIFTLGDASHFYSNSYISSITGQYFNNVKYAINYPGGSAIAKINAAIADCPVFSATTSNNSCIVVLSPTMGCGEYSVGLNDNVLLVDQRGCAQSTGLRYNLLPGFTGGNVRNKMYLQDNWSAPTTGITGSTRSSSSLYVASFVDNPEASTGTIEAFNANMFANSMSGNMTAGNLIGIEGQVTASILGGINRTINNMRGGTFNSTVGNNITGNNVTSLYAQAPLISGTGVINNAYSLQVERPTGAGTLNCAINFVGDTCITNAPRMTVNGFNPSIVSVGTWAPIMTTEQPITVTRLEMIPTTAAVGCGTFPVVSVFNNTDASIVTSLTVNTTTFIDSGPISVNVPAGKSLVFTTTTAASGSPTNVANVNVIMQYRMQ